MKLMYLQQIGVNSRYCYLRRACLNESSPRVHSNGPCCPEHHKHSGLDFLSNKNERWKLFCFSFTHPPQLNHVPRSILCSDSVQNIDNRFSRARRCCITQFCWLVAFFFPLKIRGGNFSSEIMQINNCFILQMCVRRVMKHFEKLRKHSRTKSYICLYLEELLRIFSSSPNLSRLNKPLLVHETNC